MQIEVEVVGYRGTPSARRALLTTEHPFCANGIPVVVVNTRPHCHIDAVLEGWYILTNGRDDEEIVQAWRKAVTKYSRCQRDRALLPGAVTQKATAEGDN